MEFELLFNPIENIFLDLVRNSKHRMLFASPFIKSESVKKVLSNKSKDVRMRILTTYKLANFHRKASDIDAIKDLIDHKIKVRKHDFLHAKTYIFVDENAIVTSGNLTLRGMILNYECGILVREKQMIKKMSENYLDLFNNNSLTSQVTEKIISVTKDILSKIPLQKKIQFKKSEQQLFENPEEDLYDGGIETIRGTLRGWHLDVFNAVANLPENTFTLNQIYFFEKEFKQRHPTNNKIKAKIRQQLQQLRDMGLVEFLGNGNYRKLWKSV